MAPGVANELLKAGNGARGVIFAWQEGSDIGHFFNAVNHGGNVKFLDGQAGGYVDLDWDHWEFMHAGSGCTLITLEAATLAAQEFVSRNLPEADGLRWGFLFRGISRAGLYLLQITVTPSAPNGRPRFGGSPGVVVDSKSGECRYVRGHSEYKGLLREIADSTA
ncbi:toxin glutamine deamidase domain-containing protein [Streptomyces sp. NPDC049687]|uniref:toxin glutamine deamidase domain-containing protein n=1 Tax=Streptomyces sp. NPDC049687 TaxID=3365596 RepID=UPI00378C36F2